ncbi:uncharacterized protein LOC127838576 isoform X2 [Dreissena polymorpha]|uniref:uncharacterized protein LOC127838576 isoform X2 n=1 Tax=Dreissena polymorpha TaxID=45954 RepID=UPI002264DF7C|nr:uncharacterized protein LOC127838576 isoform X2 [Dreissena polymorpha]
MCLETVGFGLIDFGVFGITLDALNAIEDGKPITLKCNTHSTDLLFIVSKCTPDECTSKDLAECVFILPHCMFYDAQNLNYYAIQNTRDGAELTITSLTAQHYGTYTCAEIHDTENNATLQVYGSKKDANHTIAYTVASIGAFIVVVCAFTIWCIRCKQPASNTYFAVARNHDNSLTTSGNEENKIQQVRIVVPEQDNLDAQNRGPQDVNDISRHVQTSDDEIARPNDKTYKQPTILPPKKTQRQGRTGFSTWGPTRSRDNGENILSIFKRSDSLKNVNVGFLKSQFEEKEKQNRPTANINST